MGQQIFQSGTDGPEERRFVSGYNSSSATIAAGAVIVWDVADLDGQGFNLPATASGGLVAGILLESVAKGATTQKILTRGIHAAALVEGTTDITLGDSLKPVDGQRYLVKDGSGALASTAKQFTALEADAADSETTAKVFVNVA